MVYIWVRATVDWADEAAVMAQASASLRSKIAVWNATLTIPYHAFRQELRELALQNLSRVENAVCSAWEEIPEGALVLPVDDDDWFSPEVARVLEAQHDGSLVGYRWPACFLEVPRGVLHRFYLFRRRILPWTPRKYVCSTNNYALVKLPGSRLLAENHMRASRAFAGEARADVRKLRRRLSLMNRSLASQTNLGFGRPSLTVRELVAKYERYGSLYDEPDLSELAWARPYVERMAELMGRLRLRTA